MRLRLYLLSIFCISSLIFLHTLSCSNFISHIRIFSFKQQQQQQYFRTFDYYLHAIIEITVYSRLYDIYESAHVVFQKDARNDDYVLSIKRSKYHSITKFKNRIIFVCDRNDIYKFKKDDRKRDVISIKCDCSHKLNFQHSMRNNRDK